MSFFSTKVGSISIAAAFAAIVIAGAWYASKPSATAIANAESTDEILKAYSVQDTDGDGLPDWEESLYGTDPAKSDTNGLGMTDAEAVAQGKIKLKVDAPVPAGPDLSSSIPGPAAATSTLTDQFSRVFFQKYVESRGSAKPTAEEMATFVSNAVQSLQTTRVRPDAYSPNALTVSGSGAAALRTYAAAVDQALAANEPGKTYSEATYFSDAVEKNDASAIQSLKQIAAGYNNTAAAIARVPVPAEAKAADLALVNGMALLGSTVSDLASVQDDPIRGMLGLQEYPGDVTALVKTLGDMKKVFDADGVIIAKDAPGSGLYGTMLVLEPATP